MEDQRVAWMKERVYAALVLHEDSLFVDMPQMEENWVKRELLDYLDQPAAQYSPAVLFYPLEGGVEMEEEVMEGNIAPKAADTNLVLVIISDHSEWGKSKTLCLQASMRICRSRHGCRIHCSV